MTEMILPGVYIEVRPEGLIVPGRVTVGNLGVVGTASKGPIEQPVLLDSYATAREVFGEYDPWIDGASDELTLVRALELAFDHGATRVFAVRVSGRDQSGTLLATPASVTLASASGDCVVLTANSPGSWGNDLMVNVWDAEEQPFVEDEAHTGAAVTLSHHPVIKSARNRIRQTIAASGVTRTLSLRYDDEDFGANPLQPGEVRLTRSSGVLQFGDAPAAGDSVSVSYMVDSSQAVKVTLRYGRLEEQYTVVSGADLAADVGRRSAWVTAEADATNGGELPSKSVDARTFAPFRGGNNGESGADYKTYGLDILLNVNAHIIVAAGQDDSLGRDLDAHCQLASGEAYKRERVGVVGSANDAALDDILGHNLASDRLIFVAPGIQTTDRAATPPKPVTLPGAYAAAAVAGLLASYPAHVSLTNKILRVGGVEPGFSQAELAQLVQSRVLALEVRQGYRTVKGITTATNTAWHQITTRRIVDYAKFGVRSAALPYIGLLNNERVRGALRATVNSFLADMVTAEMLVSYELDVTATRDDERKGIARVTMVLRPVFSIDFIAVTMFLE